MANSAKFVSTLMHSRTQAHIFHLQSTSYAEHKALEKYYEGIVDLIDDYAEVCQGRHGIITGYEPLSQIHEGEGSLKYFMGLQKFVDSIRTSLPQDGDLTNIVDEISTLVNKTVYKLRFLK